MRYLELGNTGLKVSEFGFGGIPIQRISDAEATEILTLAYESGVTFFDTATGYGTSEERMGRALSAVRERIVLATKNFGGDGKECREFFEQSLRRLRTDYVDIFQFHNVGTPGRYAQIMAPGGAYEFAVRAREKGQIRHIGFSSHNNRIALDMVRTGQFATAQIAFNLLGDRPAAELFPEAKKRGMGVIVMKPFGGGQIESAATAFKYLRQFPELIPIPGFESKAQITEILDIYKTPNSVTDADRAEWERLKKEVGPVYCRRCGYCMPCPAGVDIVALTTLNSTMKRFPADRLINEPAWEALARSVDKCADCGKCEEKCPYTLATRTVIRDNSAAFLRWKGEQGA